MGDGRMIVCNRCLLFKSDAPDQSLLYYIANCGHVFCANCRETCQGCFVCQNPNVHFSAIDESMKSDMKLILAGPEAVCRAFEQSLSFQNMHMNLFHDSTEKKINAMQKAVQDLEKDCGELKKMASIAIDEANTLEAENARLEAEVKNLEGEISSMRSNLAKSATPTNSIPPDASTRLLTNHDGFTRHIPELSRHGQFVTRLACMDGFTSPPKSKASKIFNNLSFTSNMPKWF